MVKEGNSLVFTSTRELTPDEIADAVQNKIESEGVNMIQFCSGSKSMLTMFIKLKCIIFVKYPDKIYKIIDGSAVRM